MISRIAISDISPAVYFGGEFLPVKAVAGETIQVSATAVIEGHEKLSAQVVLHDSKGKVVSRADMKETWPGTNRYEGSITIPAQGDYFFVIEADSTSQYRTVYGSTEKYPIRADRERALSGAWYEFFPRSEGAVKNADGTTTSGTFVTATKRLPAVAAMGFDVLYLPPIHPIGVAHRKGPNNSLTAGPNDPGVPWAIGNSDGGHDAINPELGTMKDFENFVAAAKKAGLEIALDLALQTSPDHPWVKSNPQWFNKRADGTIAYAENPPKKYQDIYPINFDDDYEGIRDEVLRIIRLWVSKGVKIFRVDNPHTKPVHFWQDLLDIVRRESPEVIFLAEAFTAPAMMHALGKAGFHQSYTYFTWRTSKSELTEYGREVAQQTSAFFRPNFWVNTPDINPFHLQSGNPAMFALRAVLASTLTPSWGMYAGYEIYEHRPFKEGGEEYLDSEKYEIKVRDWDGATKKGLTLAPFITQLNAIRKANPALQQLRNLVFHNTESEAIIAYSKREGKNLVLVVVNLDPSFAQGTIVHWDMNALGLEGTFAVKDLLDGKSFDWSEHQFIQLDPTRPVGKVAHICQVKL
ncbi:AmyA Glycosidases [Candidatus Planktophila vernalis]|mgnify:FL=1|uniref:alpha-1,4-glucan--maltose-1-phosphate maltosyltransferase n=1 Tax=Candidatus Planktophila vernalis TaxID=1884907 RepID=UPI003CFA83A7